MRQLPDRRRSAIGKLPSDIDGDEPGHRKMSEPKYWATMDRANDDVEVWVGEEPPVLPPGSRCYLPYECDGIEYCAVIATIAPEAWHANPSNPRVTPGDCVTLPRFEVMAGYPRIAPVTLRDVLRDEAKQ